MSLRNQPIPTKLIVDPEQFRPSDDSLYIYGRSSEYRSNHVDSWRSRVRSVRLLSIEKFTRSTFGYSTKSRVKVISLRGRDGLRAFFERHAAELVYIDITGLPHHVWGPLLRASLETNQEIRVVYAEPAEYRFQKSPTPSDIFDLSERIEGIAPIPSFVSLTDEPSDDNVVFIPLLGFEGARFAFILEQVQPPGEKIVPIVGVPGFRLEYPFYSYQGNQLVLRSSESWRNVRFASANCPFSLYYELHRISEVYTGNRMIIAPIGTKPHAVGALLFAIYRSSSVEIIYDYPIRKAKRTEGAARILEYRVSRFAGGA